MRTILELCVEADTLARDLYSRLSQSCTDHRLAETFSHMAAEESRHIEWWRDLLSAWEEGLIPDVVGGSESLEQRIAGLLADVRDSIPAGLDDCNEEEMLDTAVRVEFALLDPIFGELLELTEPGRSREHREQYSRHVERLVNAIEITYPSKSLAHFLARVLRRAWRDNTMLTTYATRDSLTGLLNRRGLVSHLSQWVSWAERYGRYLAVLLVDVDHFKRINDQHGHALGDISLKSIAVAIRDSVRASDLVARYGGDEFAVIAPETDAEEYVRLVERIMSAVRDANVVDWDGSRIAVTVSVGGAVISPPFTATDRTPDELLAAADESLYRAKQSGRDRAGDATPVTSVTSA